MSEPIGTTTAAINPVEAGTPITQAVFIDSRTPDLADLLAGALPGEKVFVLDPGQDGLDQIAADLAANGLTGLSSISLVGHGASGQILLGSAAVDEGDLSAHAGALAAIGAALAPGGDLSLYGCDVAAGAAGREFIADLSAYAGGADVAAATHPVGSADAGGSFALDASTGLPVTHAAFTAAALEQYQGVLAAVPVTGPAATASLPGDTDVFLLADYTANGSSNNYIDFRSVNTTGAQNATPQATGTPTTYAAASNTPQGSVRVLIDPANGVYFVASRAC